MFGVKEFLLNMLYIILAVFAYQILWVDRVKPVEKKKQNQYIIAVLCGTSIILCMTFPVTIFPGYVYDLRKIPLLLSVFYGGPAVGIFLTAFTLVYRLFLGGYGAIGTMLMYPIFTCIALYFRPRFKRYTLKQKLLLFERVDWLFSFILSHAYRNSMFSRLSNGRINRKLENENRDPAGGKNECGRTIDGFYCP